MEKATRSGLQDRVTICQGYQVTYWALSEDWAAAQLGPKVTLSCHTSYQYQGQTVAVTDQARGGGDPRFNQPPKTAFSTQFSIGKNGWSSC